MRLIARVQGHRWHHSWGLSEYDYPMEADTTLEAVESIDQIAGDFERVERFKLYELVPCCTCGQETENYLGEWAWIEQGQKYVIVRAE